MGNKSIEFISEKVIPAIMPEGFDHLKGEMKRFISLVPLVQIDVMDGKFTDSKSWPYKNGIDSEFIKIINQEEGFPFWEDLNIEVDLMVADPVRAADQWIAAGAARIIVHYESAAPDIVAAVLKSVKEKGIESGLAIGIDTFSETFTTFYDFHKDNIDSVQFMGIDKIGFQGQPFNDKVIENIKKFHENYPQAIISVDGGVNLNSALPLAEAKVSRFVVGSALSQGDSLEKTIEQFNNFLKIA